jgi:hypothetical protein
MARVSARTFPFTPRLTSDVEVGDFWGIRLRRGGWYACGRVLRLDSRVMLTVGLLDWCEPAPPTSERIGGARVLDWGVAHVKTVELTGGRLLGHRDLAEDGGLVHLVGVSADALGDEPVWGYLSIEDKAHDRFGRHFPEEGTQATERPSALSG